MAAGSPIPLLRPALPSLDAYRTRLEGVWESRMLSNFGSQAQRLEELCRAYGGWTNSSAAANCDLGLILAIAALELPEGSTVLLPSFTFNSTLHAALWNRLRPRFVDVDSESFCLSPAAVKRALDEDVSLILATHVFGAACHVHELARLAKSSGAALAFDAAHAFGTQVDGHHVGRFGDASVFSFSGTKLVTCGEGGVATFADDAVAERFRYLRAYGFRHDYESRFVGLNAKLSELHAALGTLTIPRVEAAVAVRQELADRYRGRLASLPDVRFQRVREGERPSHTYFPVEVGEREALASHLADAGIQTKSYFRPLHDMELFASLPAEPMPVTERLGRRVLCLPLYEDLSPSDLDRVCDEIEGFAAGR